MIRVNSADLCFGLLNWILLEHDLSFNSIGEFILFIGDNNGTCSSATLYRRRDTDTKDQIQLSWIIISNELLSQEIKWLKTDNFSIRISMPINSLKHTLIHLSLNQMSDPATNWLAANLSSVQRPVHLAIIFRFFAVLPLQKPSHHLWWLLSTWQKVC